MVKRLFALITLVLGVSVAQAAPPIPPDLAKAAFTQAHTLALRDGGALWGQSLAGPMMFVDPATRSLVANQDGAEGGGLREENGVFTGTLPAEVMVSNTSVHWRSTRWTEILWPLPPDADEQRVMLMHESFHRLQPALGFDHFREVANAHLDGLEGRYLLRLEWLALARALGAVDDPAACKNAIADALLFRSRRQALFAGAREEETALEENEGVAEYTGVRLGCPDDADQRVRYTLGELARIAQLGSYVRSFAYATGPAYGLLLDRYDDHRDDPARGGASLPTWRVEFKASPDFARLLAARAGVTLPENLAAAVVARTADPESRRVRTEEEAREANRQQLLAADRRRLVEGPVLRIPLRHMNVQFNPSNLRPLDKLGTVYPTLRLTDDWGVLEVSEGGALLDPDWSQVTLAAPASMMPEGAKISGPGWTLELKAGWKFSADDGPKGDYHLSPSSSP